jgi:hypothetical protein
VELGFGFAADVRDVIERNAQCRARSLSDAKQGRAQVIREGVLLAFDAQGLTCTPLKTARANACCDYGRR